jgi:hypothetical protein
MMKKNPAPSSRVFMFFLIGACLLASAVTVISQFYYIASANGDDYVQTTDYARHRDKVNGGAQAPYRYRILTDYALAGVLHFAPGQMPGKYVTVSFIFRLVQNFLIFLAAYAFFRTLHFSKGHSLLGMGLLAYGMCFAFYAADVSYYTYSEVLFFLVAMILINRGQDWWILPLTILAALNREESIFIPVVLLLVRLSEEQGRVSWGNLYKARYVRVFLASVTAFFLVYFGLRIVLGPATYVTSRYGPVYPGLRLVVLNFLNRQTWIGLLQMYNLTLLALFLIKKWPKSLQVLLVGMVIPWFGAQFLFASTDETRLFLVPLALVFIPAVISLVAE